MLALRGTNTKRLRPGSELRLGAFPSTLGLAGSQSCGDQSRMSGCVVGVVITRGNEEADQGCRGWQTAVTYLHS